MQKYCIFILLLFVPAIVGCEERTNIERPRHSPRPLPEPSSFKLSGKFQVKSLQRFTTDPNLPADMKGNIKISIKSSALSCNPMRSRFESNLILTIKNIEETETYVDIDIEASGDYEGHPNEGITKAITQAIGTIAMFKQWPVTQMNENNAKKQ